MRTAAESKGKERPVDLQHRIARGRRTVLEVTGYAGGDDLLNRLRQTWSANVVLDLLADRLTKATREHLIDAGFLRARIEVEVDRPDSDTDRARVRIDPGCAPAPATLRSEATRCSRPKRCRSSQRRVDSMLTRGRIRPR